jgi:hypothetical protein
MTIGFREKPRAISVIQIHTFVVNALLVKRHSG